MKSSSFYDVPIVMVSALEDPSIIKEGLQAGASEYSKCVISNEANSNVKTEGDITEVQDFIIAK